jgi:hypothetical protein
MLSHYYFSRSRKARDHFPVEGELPEWLLTSQARAAATAFTKMFVGDIEVAKRLATSGNRHEMGAAAAVAIENLSQFAIVGTLEHLGDFETAIQQRYGVRSSVGHLRNNPTYPKFGEQPTLVQDRLRELCQEDMMIYERFVKEPPLTSQ